MADQVGIKRMSALPVRDKIEVRRFCRMRGGVERGFPRRGYRAGVNGIMRQHILAKLAPSPFRVVEVTMRPDALREADEVVVCNALMPLVPVRRWDDKCWSARELYHFLAPLCELSD